LQQIYERWLRPYEAQWADALLNLKRNTETPQEGSSMIQSTPMDFFQTEQEVLIDAEPSRVFNSLLDADAWWSHRYSDDSKGLRLEPHIGGRFYEAFDDDNGALYATVSSIKRGEHLELYGSIGMAGAVLGYARFDLEDRGGATLLKLSHRAFGEIGEQRKQGYTRGWVELLNERLKKFVEQGIRYR
jgi:uncharacterized protein YndB with AHSA1/START domain